MPLIDLLHGGHERVIGCYLLDTPEGPALLDCGPSSTLPALRAGLAEHGLAPADVGHLLLTHIHLDHAGAAGVLASEHPGLRVHVSAVGAPHLVDPARLERSARRLYGEAFDRLWGELRPLPRGQVELVSDDVLGLECFPTTGHASHHVSYLAGEGTLYAGDAAGVRIQPGRHVLPPTPPPDIDLEAWYASIEEIERRSPERLALIHFGVFADPSAHLDQLRERLGLWGRRVGGGASGERFAAAARRDLAESGEEPDVYERPAPLDQCYQGLSRYWEKRRARQARRRGEPGPD